MIPKADVAFIGGSGTNSINFPEDLNIKPIIFENFETPFGVSPKFKYFGIGKNKVLTCEMHGWRKGVERGSASLQIFYIFKQAGVKKVFTEGGVGSIRSGIRPGDLVVPDDFIDQTMRKNLSICDDYLLIMREPVCPSLSYRLKQVIKKTDCKLHEGGTYVCTDGRRFESKAEVKMYEKLGADIIGQSMVPEVYLSREIGACFASLQLVVNYAEGITEEWDYDIFKEYFFSKSKDIAEIILNAISNTSDISCSCGEYRKRTLIKE